MRWLVFPLLAVIVLAALPATSRATRCTARCRQVARGCKQRCKASYAHYGPRHNCYDACRAREHNCKARCP